MLAKTLNEEQEKRNTEIVEGYHEDIEEDGLIRNILERSLHDR